MAKINLLIAQVFFFSVLVQAGHYSRDMDISVEPVPYTLSKPDVLSDIKSNQPESAFAKDPTRWMVLVDKRDHTSSSHYSIQIPAGLAGTTFPQSLEPGKVNPLETSQGPVYVGLFITPGIVNGDPDGGQPPHYFPPVAAPVEDSDGVLPGFNKTESHISQSQKPVLLTNEKVRGYVAEVQVAPFGKGELWLFKNREGMPYLYIHDDEGNNARAMVSLPDKCALEIISNDSGVFLQRLCPQYEEQVSLADTVARQRHHDFIVISKNASGEVVVTLKGNNGESVTISLEEYRLMNHYLFEALLSWFLGESIDYVRGPHRDYFSKKKIIPVELPVSGGVSGEKEVSNPLPAAESDPNTLQVNVNDSNSSLKEAEESSHSGEAANDRLTSDSQQSGSAKVNEYYDMTQYRSGNGKVEPVLYVALINHITAMLNSGGGNNQSKNIFSHHSP